MGEERQGGGGGGGGGGGILGYVFEWVCAAQVSKFGPCFRKDFHSKFLIPCSRN